MENVLTYLAVFVTGGILCVIAQILIDKTKVTPARILVGYVVSGVILTAIGIYEPLVKWAKAGATVPLTGFGYSLAQGASGCADRPSDGDCGRNHHGDHSGILRGACF